MTTIADSSPVAVEDRPRRPPSNRAEWTEIGASAGAAVALVWAPFQLVGLDAPLGFVVCTLIAFLTIFGLVVRQRHGVLALKDRLATVVIAIAVMVALLPLALLLWYVVSQGSRAFLAGFPSFTFVRQDMARFSETAPLSRAGMSQAIVGTIEQVGLATIATVPVGVLTAAYLNEVGGRFAVVVRTIADAMTGLPSIIAGLFVYTAWILKPAHMPFSGLAASMALCVVMLPTVIRTAEEVLRLVSDTLREAALALGAPEWRMVLQVVVPTARTGLVTAVILGIARAVGETAPVLFTAFGNPHLVLNPVSGHGQDDLPLRVYQLAFQPSTKSHEVAWGGALLLIVIVLTLFSLARILSAGGATSQSMLTRLRRRFAR